MTCRHCGENSSPQTEPGPRQQAGRAVARVGDLAEAGYLVSLLEAEGVSAAVKPVESFNAVSGAWALAHEISVVEDQCVAAARILRDEADARRDAADEPPADRRAVDSPFDAAPVGSGANFARPITLLLVAAAVAWGLFGRLGGARDRRPIGGAEPTAALEPALRALGQPLYAADGPNRPRHRFRFDTETGCWELASDADRDGRFETLRRFQTAIAN